MSSPARLRDRAGQKRIRRADVIASQIGHGATITQAGLLQRFRPVRSLDASRTGLRTEPGPDAPVRKTVRMSGLVSGVDAVAASGNLPDIEDRRGQDESSGTPCPSRATSSTSAPSTRSCPIPRWPPSTTTSWTPSLGKWTFDDNTVTDTSWRANPTTTHGTVGFVDGRFGRALSLNAHQRRGFAQATYPGAQRRTGASQSAARVRVPDRPRASRRSPRRTGPGSATSRCSTTATSGARRSAAGPPTPTMPSSRGPTPEHNESIGTGIQRRLRWGVYDHPAEQATAFYIDSALVRIQDGVNISAAQRRMAISRGQPGAANAEFFTGDSTRSTASMGALATPEIAEALVYCTDRRRPS